MRSLLVPPFQQGEVRLFEGATAGAQLDDHHAGLGCTGRDRGYELRV